MAKKGKVRFSKQQHWAVDELEDYLDERDAYEIARTPRRGPRPAESADRGDRRVTLRAERAFQSGG